jgi:hypothetical protein
MDQVDRPNSPDDNRTSVNKHLTRYPECVAPRRSHFLPSFLVTAALLILVQTATPAFAWGRLGHRVISRIAEKNLTPQAKAAIAELLELGQTLATPRQARAAWLEVDSTKRPTITTLTRAPD